MPSKSPPNLVPSSPVLPNGVPPKPVPVGPRPPARVLRELEWKVVRRLDGRLQGSHRTLFHGGGIDVSDLREYVPSDEARHIDWNVTARLDTPYVRRYAEDREVTLWLLCDRSASMSFGPLGRGKDVVLTEVAGTLAAVFTRAGNRVGAMLYDNGVERLIPPGGTRRHVLYLMRELLRPPAPSQRATDLAPLLHAALLTVRRRSLIVVLSDLVTGPGWERPLALLAQRHDVVVLQLTDPRDTELPNAGLVIVEDAETGEQVEVDTGDPAFRRAYRDAAARHEAEIVAVTRRYGIDRFMISTGDDLVESLARVARRQTGRYRRGSATSPGSGLAGSGLTGSGLAGSGLAGSGLAGAPVPFEQNPRSAGVPVPRRWGRRGR